MAPYGRQPLFSFFFVRRETRTEFFGKRRRRRRSSGRVHWTLPPDGAHCADRSMERHAPTGAKRTAALDDDASSSTPTPAKNPVKLGKTADGWNARSLSVVVGLLFFRNSYTHTQSNSKKWPQKKRTRGVGVEGPSRLRQRGEPKLGVGRSIRRCRQASRVYKETPTPVDGVWPAPIIAVADAFNGFAV